jgi:hypothetical protein
MSPLVLAHFGHWYVSLLYLGPVFVVVAVLTFQSWRDRRNPDTDDDPDEPT